MKLDYASLYDKATSDVAPTVPPPRHHPAAAAGYALLGACAASLFFAVVLGLDEQSPKVQQAVAVTSILAAAIAFLPTWRRKRRHTEAVVKRYLELIAIEKRNCASSHL